MSGIGGVFVFAAKICVVDELRLFKQPGERDKI